MTNSAINTTNPIGIVSGGTFTNTQTSYGVAYYNGTQVVTTGAGSATDVLRSNGATMAPSFQSAPTGAGGWTLIGTKTASSSVVTFSSLTNAYPTYVVIFQSVICDPVHSNIFLQFQISTDNGSTWYNNLNGDISYCSATGLNGTADVTGYSNQLTGRTGSNTPFSGILWMYNISSGASNSGTAYMTRGMWYNFASGGFSVSAGEYLNSSSTSTSINAIQFYVAGGLTNVISSGTFSLYGISQ